MTEFQSGSSMLHASMSSIRQCNLKQGDTTGTAMNTEGLSEEVCCERAPGEGEGRGRRGPTLMWGSSLSRGPAWNERQAADQAQTPDGRS